MKKIFILLCICLVAANVMAQKLNIKGRVLEASGESVPFVTVALMRLDSTMVTGTTSGQEGTFSLTGLKEGNYWLSLSCIGYSSERIALENFTRSIDLGDLILTSSTITLGEVTVSASNRVQKVDRLIIQPTESMLKRSYGAYDLLNNMAVARLQVDPLSNSMSVSGGGTVQTRINSVKATREEVAGLRAQDILRVEYIEDPGKQYGDDELGAVVNIIVRKREAGGLLNIQASDAPFILWGENFVSGKFNYKKSEWGIHYTNTNKGANKRKRDVDETYHLGDQTIHRIQEGINDKRTYFGNDISLSYNLTEPDKYTFNAIFRNDIENTPFDNRRSKMVEQGSDESILSFTQNKLSSYSPSLDLYFLRILPHSQSLEFNLTGTLINTNSERSYRETMLDESPLANIQTNIDGHKRSVIGEGIYSRNFEKIKLSGGARYYQMIAENKYTGSGGFNSEMNQSKASAFAELQGKVNKFGYSGSVGFTRSWFKEGAEDHEYYTFTPTVRLSYEPHKGGYLRYRFSVSPSIPSLSSLTAVEQALDTIQIVRGNPGLSTFQMYTNTLDYTYSFKKLNAGIYVRHSYYNNPIMESVFVENGKLIIMDENQRSFQKLNGELSLGLNGLDVGSLKEFLSLDVSVGSASFWSKGNNYYHTYRNFYYNLMGTLSYKRFILMGQFRKNQNSLYSETITKGENLTAFMGMYNHPKVQIGAGIMFPFTNNYRVGSERQSSVAPVTSWEYVKETGRMFIIRVAYNVEFGRKHKSGSKRLNNQDTESGIIKVDR